MAREKSSAEAIGICRRSFGLHTGSTVSSRKWPLARFGQRPGPLRIATSNWPSSVSSGASEVDSFSSTLGISRWKRDSRGSSHFIAMVAWALMRSTWAGPASRNCSLACAMRSKASERVAR